MILVVLDNQNMKNKVTKICYTAIPYRASTGPEQGFPCEVFHTGTPVFNTGISLWENFTGKTLFSLQGKGLQCIHSKPRMMPLTRSCSMTMWTKVWPFLTTTFSGQTWTKISKPQYFRNIIKKTIACIFLSVRPELLLTFHYEITYPVTAQCSGRNCSYLFQTVVSNHCRCTPRSVRSVKRPEILNLLPIMMHSFDIHYRQESE